MRDAGLAVAQCLPPAAADDDGGGGGDRKQQRMRIKLVMTTVASMTTFGVESRTIRDRVMSVSRHGRRRRDIADRVDD